jgi:hypothetical protein
VTFIAFRRIAAGIAAVCAAVRHGRVVVRN